MDSVKLDTSPVASPSGSCLLQVRRNIGTLFEDLPKPGQRFWEGRLEGPG